MQAYTRRLTHKHKSTHSLMHTAGDSYYRKQIPTAGEHVFAIGRHIEWTSQGELCSRGPQYMMKRVDNISLLTPTVKQRFMGCVHKHGMISYIILTYIYITHARLLVHAHALSHSHTKCSQKPVFHFQCVKSLE